MGPVASISPVLSLVREIIVPSQWRSTMLTTEEVVSRNHFALEVAALSLLNLDGGGGSHARDGEEPEGVGQTHSV